MTSLRYTKLECSSKDVFRPPSITFLSFSFLFFWGCVLGGGGGGFGGTYIFVFFFFFFFFWGGGWGGGGGGIRDNLILVRIGGMDPCRSSTFRKKNVSVN